MKSRRNFVVELKSSRRQAKPQNRSIWGDTDLKALASEVEANLPVSHPGRRNSFPLENRSTQPIPRSESGDKQPQGLSTPRILQALPLAAVEPEAKPEHDEIGHTPEVQVTSSKGSDDEIEKNQTNSVDSKSNAVDLDDLEVLELENQRLKAMLRLQLRAENQELRIMLERLP
ncbi:hypothetical protein Q669_31975 [Labrenzia sp. C1B10]|uniref:hypothetical protein n=1 Tax=unclassified Labrenzia TaxID=2648686 RepID=UPI0003B8D9A1|nr:MULTISPECIES: hypothetical protein [unclassified Labrenzia]ERP92522.1 hypothetical protein Q669_31975 [Labrenzia sp. C1B10]ERS04006.1 hypothetical protein Q675_31000 [Labrenzia sp. C1B70]